MKLDIFGEIYFKFMHGSIELEYKMDLLLSVAINKKSTSQYFKVCSFKLGENIFFLFELLRRW